MGETPKLGERDDVGGLEIGGDPVPRRCSMSIKEFRAIWVAAAKRMEPSVEYLNPEERAQRQRDRERDMLLIALKSYANRINMQPSELEFVQVTDMNVIQEFLKHYMHFNFLVRVSGATAPTLFFAELKPRCASEEDVYLCTPVPVPVEQEEEGHAFGACLGCRHRAKELVHPRSGGYLGGHELVYCYTDAMLDSDDDDYM
ncbi:uncharacterized protein LOC112269772 [Brachypodium distachyon]|uniref:DUF3615 domain-containing protein n=1 Tax=Brachypodium distachyon TaxID=15368 RepID=C3SAC5_BRADI|nr:uncharacterized protein LOC112269772 [Brachypodium distachyon]ACF22759.1 hypothetical protein-3 [Brachypodium distachyon]KQK24136.1 hypothetical protein BRADI_1g78360v3 [Brachypodium distachyon]|eukprot:XP_024312629.1 uncharacterized protein LOC112269772 [Brachypodium distachyon]